MMPELGKYAFHVIASYLATGVGIGVLIAMTVARSRKVTRDLAAAEARSNRNG